MFVGSVGGVVGVVAGTAGVVVSDFGREGRWGVLGCRGKLLVCEGGARRRQGGAGTAFLLGFCFVFFLLFFFCFVFALAFHFAFAVTFAFAFVFALF